MSSAEENPTSRLTEPAGAERYTVRVSGDLDAKVEAAIEAGAVDNRSEAVREALRQWDGDHS